MYVQNQTQRYVLPGEEPMTAGDYWRVFCRVFFYLVMLSWSIGCLFMLGYAAAMFVGYPGQ